MIQTVSEAVNDSKLTKLVHINCGGIFCHKGEERFLGYMKGFYPQEMLDIVHSKVYGLLLIFLTLSCDG